MTSRMQSNLRFWSATVLALITPGILCAKLESRAGFFNDEPEEKCYAYIGCLSTTDDWYSYIHRPMNFEPEDPNEIGVIFTLYTRENMLGEVLRVNENGQIPSTFFKGDRKTKFIIHGFLGNAKADWVMDIMKALLARMNINVITVDWSKGAGMPYNQAAVNTRVVGLEIAYLVNTLLKDNGGSADDFHLIGHSLGAHTAGYAGERITGLGRITGLDPAGPWFTEMPTYVRLDTTDAKFVDIIHTDAEFMGFGIEEAIGHVDFFPNGGYRQPGCSTVPLKMDISEMIGAMSDAPSCSHSRSELLFLESIISSPYYDSESEGGGGDKCPFTAFLCDSYESFLAGNCTNHGEDGLGYALMGLDADKYPGKNDLLDNPRKFYLNTNSKKPFCGYHYAVSVSVAVNSTGKTPAVGDLIISAYGDNTAAKNMDLTEAGARSMRQGGTYNFLGYSANNAGKVIKADVAWKWNPSIFSMDKCILKCVKDLSLSKLEVTNMGYYPAGKFLKSTSCNSEAPLLAKNKAVTPFNLKC